MSTWSKTLNPKTITAAILISLSLSSTMASLSRLLQRTFCTSPQFVKTLSTDLHEERNLKKLVEKFKKSSETDRFRTKTGIYFSTVRRLASAKRYRWIEEILEDQKKYRDISKEGFNVRLISLYGKSGMLEQASKVFDEMPERKSERTVKSFNALLGACVNSKNYDKVSSFFNELPEKLGVTPDVVSYNTMIKAFCEMGEFDSAVSMVDEIEKNGLQPDLITFNTLLDGFYESGKCEYGDKIWARMMEKNNVVPDIRSYNAKLVGFGKEKKMEKAVEIFNELGTKGLAPDVFSYNAIIRGYCNDENLEEVKKWFGELKKKSDLAPNRATFGTILPFACEKGDLIWGFELSKDLIENRLLVDGAALQLVVDGLAKESKVEEATNLVQLAKVNNYARYKLKIPAEKVV